MTGIVREDSSTSAAVVSQQTRVASALALGLALEVAIVGGGLVEWPGLSSDRRVTGIVREDSSYCGDGSGSQGEAEGSIEVMYSGNVSSPSPLTTGVHLIAVSGWNLPKVRARPLPFPLLLIGVG